MDCDFCFSLEIVDRAADFVARNGPAFEERIRENERNNHKFSFLQLNDPYRPYYDTKVLEYKLGKLSDEVRIYRGGFGICDHPPSHPFSLSFE